jgi:hypothetical protein
MSEHDPRLEAVFMIENHLLHWLKARKWAYGQIAKAAEIYRDFYGPLPLDISEGVPRLCVETTEAGHEDHSQDASGGAQGLP